MVRNIKAWVIDPDWPSLIQRNRLKDSPKSWDEVEARCNESARRCELKPPSAIEETLSLKNRYRPNVHGGLKALKMQETRIQRREPIISGHISIVPTPLHSRYIPATFPALFSASRYRLATRLPSDGWPQDLLAETQL